MKFHYSIFQQRFQLKIEQGEKGERPLDGLIAQKRRSSLRLYKSTFFKDSS